MSIYVQKFIDKIGGFEARGAKDYIMPMSEAKGLYSDITHLLLELNNMREKLANNVPQPTSSNEVIEIKLDGGTF